MLVICFSALKDLVIIVRSQHNSFHVRKAKALKENLLKQANEMGLHDQVHWRDFVFINYCCANQCFF